MFDKRYMYQWWTFPKTMNFTFQAYECHEKGIDGSWSHGRCWRSGSKNVYTESSSWNTEEEIFRGNSADHTGRHQGARGTKKVQCCTKIQGSLADNQWTWRKVKCVKKYARLAHCLWLHALNTSRISLVGRILHCLILWIQEGSNAFCFLVEKTCKE